MEYIDFHRYTEQFPEEFAAASSFVEFAKALDASRPGPGRLLQAIAEQYPGSWEPYFQTVKEHGFVLRPLLLPKARTVRDIFASVALYPSQNGVYRDEVNYVKAGAAYISAMRAPGFDYADRLGATYEWSPKWLKRGEKICSIRGGERWVTAAVPTEEVVATYGSGVGSGEWDLATFEVIRWEDGRHLVCVRSNNGFSSQWLAILDAGETALSMLSEAELSRIAAERQRKLEAWGS